MEKIVLSALLLSFLSLNQAIACGDKDKHEHKKTVNEHKKVVTTTDETEGNEQIKDQNNEK